MVVRRTGIKRNFRDTRTSSYEKGVQTSTRYNTIAFLTATFIIKYDNVIYEEKGYSGRFNAGNDAEYDQAILDAKYNAIVQVMIKNGDTFNETDDIKNVDETIVQSAVIKSGSVRFYYPTFLDRRIFEDKLGRIRFRDQKGRYAKVGIIEDELTPTQRFERLEVGMDKVRKEGRDSVDRPLTLEEEQRLLAPNKVRARQIREEFGRRVLNGEDPEKVKKEILFRERFR